MKKWNDLERKYEIKKGIYAKYGKRAFDLLASIIGGLIISPVILALCILSRIILGSPIFFVQKRTGKDEKTFNMIKFRSMLDTRNENGELLPDRDRLTKYGDFLRRTSLDELPEIINVIKGDMSLVGPRPLFPFYLPYYNEKESIRHSVRGGITGLAQINGRALLKWDERFKKDFEYVKKITFWGDIKILLGTIEKVFKKEDIGILSITEEGGLHVVREVQRPEYLLRECDTDPNKPKFEQGTKDE